jgi:hypothetical protein
MADTIGLRLNAETEKLMTLLETLGTKLRDNIAKDVNEAGTPSRDWCRSLGHYRGGVQSLLAEQRERSKLQLMAQQQSGGRVLTDDEYTAEMRQLSLESVKQLSDDELEAEIRQRGLKVVEVTESDE